MLKTPLDTIEAKVRAGERLSKEDGLALFASPDIARIGYLADLVRQRISGDYVYFNVNRHVNLTNICVSRCRFCAFGRDEGDKKAYAMNQEEVLRLAKLAAQDPDLRELHIVSGLHPDWPFEYYLDVLRMLKRELPQLHRKAFTAVEIHYFSKLSGLSVAEVLKALQEAGLQSIPGGGAEILSDRVRQELCPNKATASEWLEVQRTAHKM